jgi:hypothetical protein
MGLDRNMAANSLSTQYQLAMPMHPTTTHYSMLHENIQQVQSSHRDTLYTTLVALINLANFLYWNQASYTKT